MRFLFFGSNCIFCFIFWRIELYFNEYIYIYNYVQVQKFYLKIAEEGILSSARPMRGLVDKKIPRSLTIRELCRYTFLREREALTQRCA